MSVFGSHQSISTLCMISDFFLKPGNDGEGELFRISSPQTTPRRLYCQAERNLLSSLRWFGSLRQGMVSIVNVDPYDAPWFEQRSVILVMHFCQIYTVRQEKTAPSIIMTNNAGGCFFCFTVFISFGEGIYEQWTLSAIQYLPSIDSIMEH